MSKPPISRSNSSNSIEQPQADESPPKKPKDKNALQAPALTTKPVAQTPFDQVFNPKANAQRQIDDESSQEEQQPQGNLSQDTKEQPKDKQAERDQPKKLFQSKPKVIVPTLNLPGSSTTATLKKRAPASPDSTAALGSHRTLSPRKGGAPVFTTSATLVDSKTSTLPDLPMPPVPQKPTISTSNVPASARSTTSAPGKDTDFTATKLTPRSKDIINKALVEGKITLADLGYLLIDVQTGGFNKPISSFDQGNPLLRSGLEIKGFKVSNGKTYDSINVIEKFVNPHAEQVFNTKEYTELRENLEKNYLPVASAVKSDTKGMTGRQMHQAEKIKNLMDPVIKPLTFWMSGDNENLASSQLPEAWKSLLLGIDDAVVQ